MVPSREIGTVVRVQIQRSSLKTGEKPKVYHPAPLLAVDRLVITAQGCVGWPADGSALLDVHHLAHPAAKSPDGAHGVSIGFTSHYLRMRGRFGERVWDGVAGENILVQTDGTWTLEDLAPGVGITSAVSGETLWLTGLAVAHPCKSYSRYCLGLPEASPEELKAALQFLDGGTRGFYASLAAPDGRAVVEVGDRVVVAVPAVRASAG